MYEKIPAKTKIKNRITIRQMLKDDVPHPKQYAGRKADVSGKFFIKICAKSYTRYKNDFHIENHIQ